MTPFPSALRQFEFSRRPNGTLWEIGRDRISTTWRALDNQLMRPIALTVVDSTFVVDDASRKLIMQRAQSIATVRDQRIAAVYEIGIQDEFVFCARQFVDGESVDQAIRRHGAFRWQDALKITMLVARGLASALDQHVRHGNISPDTIILTTPDEVTSKRDVVLVGFVLADDQDLDSRADVRALGAVLRAMLVGETVAPDHVTTPPGIHATDLSKLSSGVPNAVVQLLQEMLSVDDAAQPANATELVSRIQRTIDIASRTSTPVAVPAIEFVNRSKDVPGDLIDGTVADTPLATVNENLQFTAYRPKTVRPAVWTKLLVFAHLEDRPDWLSEDERAPFEEVQAQAQQILGKTFDAYKHSTDDSRVAVPRDGEITILPEVDGVEFNPPRRSFFWRDGIAVHAESFDMRADHDMNGKVPRGRLTIFLGRIILAEITLAIRVDQSFAAPTGARASANDGQAHERSYSRAFRKVFASYSHRDLGIVEEMERHARSLGDEYLRDWVHLRSGERWNDGLRELISAADVFQLFWSPNSARSEFVAQEWQYALTLGRNAFVRPTYWQDPMPDPPEPLKPLHFHRLALTAVSSTPTVRESTASSSGPGYSTAAEPPSRSDATGSASRVLSIAIALIVIVIAWWLFVL
ncbi:MAG: TIR domain-containing protein [Gemmatimonadaceae bacterium]